MREAPLHTEPCFPVFTRSEIANTGLQPFDEHMLVSHYCFPPRGGLHLRRAHTPGGEQCPPPGRSGRYCCSSLSRSSCGRDIGVRARSVSTTTSTLRRVVPSSA